MIMDRLKRLSAAIVLPLLLASCSPVPEETLPSVFEGRFIGYGGEYVEFFLIGEDGYVEVPVEVADDGSFCDTLNFGTVYDCALFADRFMFRVCIEEGKHYNAEFDLTTGTETDFRFYGDGEKENLYLSHYWEKFCTMETLLKECSSYDRFEDYIAAVDAVADGLRAELEAIDNIPFKDYYGNEFDRIRSTYVRFYPLNRVASSGTYRPETEYLEALKADSAMDDAQYSAMLRSVTGFAPYLFPEMNLREGLRAVSDFGGSRKRKEQAVSALINAYVDAGCNSALGEAYEYYKENVRKPDSELCAKVENAMTLSPGTEAPDIAFEDMDGNVFHLSDFRGKPLYVDFWASWCGPCCEEIPYMAKLVAGLGADPEIVCISISIDEERDNWTAKLSEEELLWPQFIATAEGLDTISGDYGVNGIPRFMLFNPDGTIASINAPRPSCPGVLDDLRELLVK